MKERPILFSGAMVQAILEGRKTQTRRVVKPSMSAPRVAPLRMEPYIDGWTGEQEVDDQGLPCWLGFHPDYPGEAKWFSCPYGVPGDRFWVRETWNALDITSEKMWTELSKEERLSARWYPVYKVDEDPEESGNYDGPYAPSIHMPRWASRLTLEITDVRVERVQNISEVDAQAEGWDLSNVPEGRCYAGQHARWWFRDLWDSINAKRGYGWATNPWVWALTFKVV